MSLRLHDSASREVTPFEPIVPGRVGIYVCGATVQSAPHVGHLRPAVVFDVLRRWLTRCGNEVTLIRNITDIDDKILAKAEQAGVPWWAHAASVEREFSAAYDALGVLPPTFEPRATAHLPQMIEMVERLIERGHAYVTSPGNVWFDVESWDAYGELTGQSSGTRSAADAALVSTKEVEPVETSAQRRLSLSKPPVSGAAVSAGSTSQGTEKRGPRDFALFKAPKPGEPETAAWNTPWGPARPGWHIECSAMAHRYLGAEFDIHGGGLDLRFPHHENEQAQSRAAGYGFAHRWMHSAWITQSGEKMSKSLGNGLLASEVLASAHPAAVRLAIVKAHYSSMLEWTQDTLAEATATWARFTSFVTRATKRLGANAPTSTDVAGIDLSAKMPAFADAMDDDLGVPRAIAEICKWIAHTNALMDKTETPEGLKEILAAVRAMLDVLGLDPLDPQWERSDGASSSAMDALDVLVGAQLEARAQARANKDWAASDAIRDMLAAAGVEVADSRDGATWTLK